MARILDARTQLDSTVRIFDDFYTFDLVVNGIRLIWILVQDDIGDKVLSELKHVLLNIK